MPRYPNSSRRLALDYRCIYGRRIEGLRPRFRESGFNVCVGQLGAALRVYGFYRTPKRYLPAVHESSFDDLDFLFAEAVQSGDMTVFVRKSVFKAVNKGLYFVYAHFLRKGNLQIAGDIQLAYLNEFACMPCIW